MKIQNTKSIKTNAIKLIALAMLLTATVFAGGAAAQTTEDISKSTGMFGITRNQTARLNVVNLGKTGVGTPDTTVLLSFIDGDGNVLSQKLCVLGAGKSARLDIKWRDVPTQGNRAQLRAVVRFVGTPDTRTYMWTPTLEVFDNESGETRLLIPALQKVQITGVE
jgi:hypothetical protein